MGHYKDITVRLVCCRHFGSLVKLICLAALLWFLLANFGSFRMTVNMQYQQEIATRFNAWCRATNRPYPSVTDGQAFFHTAASQFPSVKNWIGDDWQAFHAFLKRHKLVKDVQERR
jgi:hypothetical protein